MSDLLDSLDWTRESIDEALGNLMDAWRHMDDFDLSDSMNRVKDILNEAMGLVEEMMDGVSDPTIEVSFESPKLSKFMEDESDE